MKNVITPLAEETMFKIVNYIQGNSNHYKRECGLKLNDLGIHRGIKMKKALLAY